jgi:hypothetical protein
LRQCVLERNLSAVGDFHGLGCTIVEVVSVDESVTESAISNDGTSKLDVGALETNHDGLLKTDVLGSLV